MYSKLLSFLFPTLAILFFFTCNNSLQAPLQAQQINPKDWVEVELSDEQEGTFSLKEGDIFIDENWNIISAKEYGDQFRYHLHSKGLYKKGETQAFKIDPIRDRYRLAPLIRLGKSLDKVFDFIGQPLPIDQLTDIKGNSYNKTALEGKILVFSFWFKGCAPCEKEMPELNALVDHYQNKNVLFFGLGLDNIETIQNFLTKESFKFIQIPEQGSLAKTMQLPGYPTNFIVDPKGSIQFLTVGGQVKGVMGKILEENIESLLNKVY